MATVNLEDLKPNSHAYKESLKTEKRKEEKEKLKAVVKQANVVSTKKPLSKKFAETFIEDDVKDIKSYVVMDVVIPGIKNTILDILSMLFFGEGYRGGGRRSREDHYDYSARYKYRSSRDDRRSSKGRERDREERYEGNEKVDYRNIILRNRGDAEDVVDQMRHRIEKYDSASIADLFDLIDVTGKYTDNNWGWDRPDDIQLRRVSSGYLIDVPEAILLD